MDTDTGKHWWYSLTRHAVEDDDGPTRGKDRLGPYATREEASPRPGTWCRSATANGTHAAATTSTDRAY